MQCQFPNCEADMVLHVGMKFAHGDDWGWVPSCLPCALMYVEALHAEMDKQKPKSKLSLVPEVKA